MTEINKMDYLLKGIQKDDEGKYDFKANLHDIQYDETSGNFVIPYEDEIREFGSTDNAFSQIMTKIGIPSKYARKTPPNLIKSHFDYWKQTNENKKLFIRAKEKNNKNIIRAFLSKNYSVLDNTEIVDCFREVVPESKYRLIDYEIGEDMFNARFIFNDLFDNHLFDPDGKYNKFYCGLHISNGETGRYNVTADLIIWEMWCSNGAVSRREGKPLLLRKHVGSDLHLTDIFQNSLSGMDEKCEILMQNFIKTRNKTVNDPVILLNEVMDKRKDLFPEANKEKVIEIFNERPEESVYGVISAITQFAQTVPYEKRILLENFAGDLIEAA